MGIRGNAEESEGATLEDEIAEQCGILNVATGRLVSLIGRVLATGSYAGAGIRSPEQWVAWKCGVSIGRARVLVNMARRLPELAETRSALEAGELAEDQVAVICRHTPAHNDAEAAELARSATVSQLRRALGRHTFAKPAPDPEAEAKPEPEDPSRASFGFGDDSLWRLSAVLGPDEGALVERALGVYRQKLMDDDVPGDVSWAGALVAMAEGSLAAEAVARPHYDRHLVVIHVGADDENKPNGHVHLGPALPDAMRRFLSCDAKAHVQHDAATKPLSVGRRARIVSNRTRLAIEERDGGCRVPGCDRTRWLHVHHIVHWEDGGATDTANLMALCSKHHRQHHRGQLGIEGDADDPSGIAFTDARGRPLASGGQPIPPTEPAPAGNWTHPSGERMDDECVVFSEPAGTPAQVAAAALASPAQDYPDCIDLDDPVYGADDDEDEVRFG